MRSILVLFLICSCNLIIAQSAPMRVWVDTDIMIGKAKGDVDDGIALQLLLQSPEVEIVGISLTQNVDYGYEMTQNLLKWYADGTDIPVLKGALNRKEVFKETAASQALIAVLESERLTILSLGPATNIATVLRSRPDLADQIESIVFCMGRKPGMRFAPGKERLTFSDYNFDLDVESMREVLKHDLTLTLSGYDCADEMHLNKRDLKALKQGHEGDRWLFKQYKRWNRIYQFFIGSKKGFIPYDLSTVGSLVWPEHFDLHQAIPLEIVRAKNDSKRQITTAEKDYLEAAFDKNSPTTCSYCSATKTSFKAFVLERILPKNTGK